MTSSRSTAATETARDLAHRWVNGDLSGRYSCVEQSMDRHSYECDLVMGAIVARDAETAAIKVALRNAEVLLAQVHDIPWGDGGGGERFCVVCNFGHREEDYKGTQVHEKDCPVGAVATYLLNARSFPQGGPR